MLNNIKSSTQTPAYFLTCKYTFIFDVLVLDLHQANFVVLLPDEININQYLSNFLHNSLCTALHLLENKTFHICPVFENLHRSWPLYSRFITLVSSLPIANDYSVSLYYLITRAQADPAGRGVRVTTFRCVPVTGPWVLGWEGCPAELRQLTLPASCLFSNFQLPVAPVQWPPPNPCWGWRSAVCWNLRSKPPDPIPYFCSRAVLWITRLSFKQQVMSTNLRDSKRHPPCWGVLEFLNPYQL